MKRNLWILLIACALVPLTVLPAAAELYTVHLTNGFSMETRYRPKVDPRDEAKAYVLTDQGTWIALEKTLIQSVISLTEARGFGKVIDTTTIDLGWAPNDTPVPDGSGGVSDDPRAEFMNFLRDQSSNRPNVTTPQFVNPGQAGQGGIPVYTGAGSNFP